MFQFANEHAARCRDFAGKVLDALGLSVFVVETAKVRTVVGPLVNEETCNLRVALECRNLVVLALESDAINISVERFEVRPNRKLVVGNERFHRLEFVLDGLLALDAARTGDGGCTLREKRVVLERHQNLVLDIVQYWFFFVLEVAVAKARIRNHELQIFLVEHVGEVVRISCTRVFTRVHSHRGILRNAVDRNWDNLTRILMEVCFVVEVNTVEVADRRAACVDRANCIQELVTVLKHERSVFRTENPSRDTRMVVLVLDHVVDEFLRDFETLSGRTHRVDREFLEHEQTNLVANIESRAAERSAARTDDVETCSLDCVQVLFQSRVLVGPEAAFAPLLVVAHAHELHDGIVNVVVAFEAIELAETKSSHDREGIFRSLALCALDFELHFNREQVRVFRTPNALVSLPVLDTQQELLRGVFLFELDFLEVFENIAVRILHEDAEARLVTARIVEERFDRNAFLVHVRFDVNVRNESGVTENQINVTADTAIRILRPGEAHRHFARMSIAVVCAFLAFTTKVNAAVRCTHVCHADAENVFFAELNCLLSLNNKGRIGTKMVAQKLTVQPNCGVRCNLFKTEENTLRDLLFVINRESFEIERAVLCHQKLVKCSFPNVGNANSLSFFRIRCIPTIGDAGIFCVPDHLPIAIKANNFAH